MPHKRIITIVVNLLNGNTLGVCWRMAVSRKNSLPYFEIQQRNNPTGMISTKMALPKK